MDRKLIALAAIVLISAMACVVFEETSQSKGDPEFENKSFEDGVLRYTTIDSEKVELIGHVDEKYATGELVIKETAWDGEKTYKVTSISNSAFFGCEGLTGSLTIPGTVSKIGISAFQNCTGFNDTLTVNSGEIGDYAFATTKFQTLVLNEGVTDIGRQAFSGCDTLTGQLTIPSTVGDIGNSAFDGCKGLKGSLTINYSGIVRCNIGANAFYGCTGFTDTLTIKKADIGEKAFSNTNFQKLVLLDGWVKIGANAFNNCQNLTELNTRNDWSNIACDKTAFSGCNLVKLCVDANNLNPKIYDYVDKSKLTTLSFGNNITEITKDEFKDMTNFKGSLVIPSNIKSVSANAFTGCTGFTGLTLACDGNAIDKNAFSGWIFYDSNGKVIENMSELSGHTFSGSVTDMRQIDCKVVFVIGHQTQTENMIPGAQIFQPKDPTMDKFKFVKWTIDGKDVVWPYVITGDVTITSVWEPLYEMKFLDEGSKAKDSLLLEKDSLFELPYIFKEGYIFLGWNDGNETFPAGATYTVPGEDVTFNAVWKKLHTIGFEDDGTKVLDTRSCTEGEEIILPGLVKDGYVFLGWNDGNETFPAGATYTVPGEDVTFNAVWNQVPPTLYTLAFDQNGGSVGWNWEMHKNGYVFTFPQYTGARIGYEFEGWILNGVMYNEGDKYTVTGENVIFKAVWNPISYTIDFDGNGASGSMGDIVMTYDVGGKLTPCGFSKEHFVFLGWATEKNSMVVRYLDGASVINLSSTDGDVITLYAVWSPVASGDGQSVSKGEPLVLEFDGLTVKAISLISSDGTESFVSEDMYTVGNGTSVIFKSEFTSSLESGEYMLCIVTDRGVSYASFSITDPEPVPPTPQGNDQSDLIAVIVVVAAIIGGILVCLFARVNRL